MPGPASDEGSERLARAVDVARRRHAAAAANTLAAAYHAAGRQHEAVSLYADTLSTCQRLLGDDHPLTAHVRRNLRAARHG